MSDLFRHFLLFLLPVCVVCASERYAVEGTYKNSPEVIKGWRSMPESSHPKLSGELALSESRDFDVFRVEHTMASVHFIFEKVGRPSATADFPIAQSDQFEFQFEVRISGDSESGRFELVKSYMFSVDPDGSLRLHAKSILKRKGIFFGGTDSDSAEYVFRRVIVPGESLPRPNCSISTS